MQTTVDAQTVLNKYGSIIQEEVNVKSVTLSDQHTSISVQYIPLGQMISPVFGKDTSRIIASAKAGNAEIQDFGSLIVRDGEEKRSLEPDMYELRYFGYNEHFQTVEDGIIISLDLSITEALRKEGIVRELSRFLNQMRKDAGCRIDEKMRCFLGNGDEKLKSLCLEYASFLQQEALLQSIDSSLFCGDEGEIFSAQFILDGSTLDITLASL